MQESSFLLHVEANSSYCNSSYMQLARTWRRFIRSLSTYLQVHQVHLPAGQLVSGRPNSAADAYQPVAPDCCPIEITTEEEILPSRALPLRSRDRGVFYSALGGGGFNRQSITYMDSGSSRGY